MDEVIFDSDVISIILSDVCYLEVYSCFVLERELVSYFGWMWICIFFGRCTTALSKKLWYEAGFGWIDEVGGKWDIEFEFDIDFEFYIELAFDFELVLDWLCDDKDCNIAVSEGVT